MTEESTHLYAYGVVAERAERKVLMGVLEIVKHAKRRQAKTLRNELEGMIRRRFAFNWLRCGCCDRWLPPERFDANYRTLSGKDTWCKDCRRARRRLDYKQNPEPYREEHERNKVQLSERIEECYQ